MFSGRAGLSRLTTGNAWRRSYATNGAGNSDTNGRILQAGIGANLLLTGYLTYQVMQQGSKTTKQQESLDFGMDRIDECLNRIDLRNNETTGYFEKVSQKVEALEKLEKGKK